MAWHAKLSASTAKRWINCPGSIRAIEEFHEQHPDFREKDEASPYAAEGTAAHALLEHCLKGPDGGYMGSSFRDPRDFVGGAVTAEGAVFGPDQVVRMMTGWHEVTEDMAEAVTVAVDFVLEELDRLGPGTEFYAERKWDMTWLHPDLGGTSDITMSQFLEELVVLDYKHGKGVVVEVMEETGEVDGEDGTPIYSLNEQGMTYLLGAARVDDFSHQRYKIGIIQPRAPHSDGAVRCATVSRQQLLDFRDTLLAAAEETARPNAPLRAGPWCRFCPKSGNCEAQDELTAEAAGADFDDLPLEGQELPLQDGPRVDVEAVARKLAWIPVIDAWARGVETLAQRLAENGVKVPGNKLVRKKTNRKIRDPEGFMAVVEKAGLDPLLLFNPPKMKGPAQIERLGKPFKALIKAVDPETKEAVHVYKPLGKVTLAPETDRREEVDPSAANDFDAVEDDDE